MFILLHGPLGIGKSTLAEAVTERLGGSVMLDGDQAIGRSMADAPEIVGRVYLPAGKGAKKIRAVSRATSQLRASRTVRA